MKIALSDLYLLKQRTLSAIIRDERLGEAAACQENNRKLRNRLRCYIYDNRIPEPSGANT